MSTAAIVVIVAIAIVAVAAIGVLIYRRSKKA